jgi:hypothetical protein
VGGVEVSAKGVIAVDTIEQRAIITCVGDSASVPESPAGDELQALMNVLEEGESERCQYMCAHNLQADEGFRSIRAWIVPPPDITLIRRQGPRPTLHAALKKRGPTVLGIS